MNAVEIEEAVSKLADAPFDAATFPYAFLEAFGNKETTLKRLQSGNTNQSDLPGGVLQRNNIHIKVCPAGEVAATLTALRQSAATTKQKAKFILATDGQELQAEQLIGDVPPLACANKDLPNHFAFFLPLAGITTVRQIAENAFDIRATGRLNRLYVELLKTNPDWDSNERREELNHFFARLIFCFFAEDTGIFDGSRLFTGTLETMTERDGSNTHQVLATLFQAMNTPREKRAESDLPASALRFPYVNGNLFSGSVETPRFSKIARSYLLFVGGLDWKLINPDIFGSMIQAVADDEERGALGMHYTSVPNILKVLNPLFLDDLRQKLTEAGDGTTPASKGQLKRLRDRMARIRVFDPACGSGNFLVIAYIEMRKIEAIINERRGERELPSAIPSTNFRGIEIRNFAAEIARLALIIARFQCDAKHIGDLFARKQVLPLDKDNWITCGNALRLDWLQICPPTGTGVKVENSDGRLFTEKLDQVEIDFENAGGETYICGNPPYKGSQTQTSEQKSDLADIFESHGVSPKQIDYVGGWFLKAAEYARAVNCCSAFVSTNSICQGRIVPILWPLIYDLGSRIRFAHTSFKWANLASHNAGVTVAIVGMSTQSDGPKLIFSQDSDGRDSVRAVANINAYLAAASDLFVEGRREAFSGLSHMSFGNMPVDGGNLLLRADEVDDLQLEKHDLGLLTRRIFGSAEYIRGIVRHCLWIEDKNAAVATSHPRLAERIERTRTMRLASKDKGTKALAMKAHQFREMNAAVDHMLIVPSVSSDTREYFPVGLIDAHSTVTNLAFALYDAPLWNMALIASQLHLVWIGTVCGKLKTDYRYSNTLGWNTFPVPALSDQNKADLTRCAEEILLAREAHFPATIADLYDPEHMPADLRAAHDRNDETLERIYIGRRFKNDTERLEKLFEMYTQMTGKQASATPQGTKKPAGQRKKG